MTSQLVWDYALANIIQYFSVFGVMWFVWTFCYWSVTLVYKLLFGLFLPKNNPIRTHD